MRAISRTYFQVTLLPLMTGCFIDCFGILGRIETYLGHKAVISIL